jgi:hypothetical protein
MMETREEPSKEPKKQPKGGKLEAQPVTNNATKQKGAKASTALYFS